MGRAPWLVSAALAVVVGVLAVASPGVMALDYSDFIIPDISLADVIEYFSALISDPNIYESFDLDAFKSFATESLMGRYFLVATILIYWLAMMSMLFGRRRGRKAIE